MEARLTVKRLPRPPSSYLGSSLGGGAHPGGGQGLRRGEGQDLPEEAGHHLEDVWEAGPDLQEVVGHLRLAAALLLADALPPEDAGAGSAQLSCHSGALGES